MADFSLPDNECGHGVDGSNADGCSSLSGGEEKSPSPAVTPHCSGKSATEMEEEDGFYQKLNKINESSGLSLLFDFRDTSIDLHQLYKIVTDRGGFHQVTKDAKWEEVVSFATEKDKIQFTPTQLQNLYATILYPFEQIYYYQSPINLNKTPININGQLVHDSVGKRKHDDGIYPSKKIEYEYGSWKSSQVSETHAKAKDARKDPRAPLRSRNSYHMFIKMECDRLKSIHGGTPSAKLRDEVIEEWRSLSNDKKKPYIEASKKDKERYMKEMAAYEEQMRKEMVAYEEHK